MRRIWETSKDRKIRLAQKFLMKAMRGRCEEFYGGLVWDDRGLLTLFRSVGTLSIIANCYKTKTQAKCESWLAKYFTKTANKMII
jgi:hypothetical protein